MWEPVVHQYPVAVLVEGELIEGFDDGMYNVPLEEAEQKCLSTSWTSYPEFRLFYR